VLGVVGLATSSVDPLRWGSWSAGCEGCVIHLQMTHARTPHPTTFHTNSHHPIAFPLVIPPQRTSNLVSRCYALPAPPPAPRQRWEDVAHGWMRWRDGGVTFGLSHPRKGGWG